MERNLTTETHKVSDLERSSIKGHSPAVIWLTGLSGSGKSTIARELDHALFRDYKAHTFVLDGDNIRQGLNSDLGFSDTDRSENIRRIAEVANLMASAGLIVITAFISPFGRDRDVARRAASDKNFFEIHVNCPLEECEKRDPKGLYKKARAGEIREFTGIDSPYETPSKPEIVLDTDKLSPAECVRVIIDELKKRRIIDAE
ncbi:adenylyl-sulfate kinase [Limisalsivibrio acetivorans]|uniref:adenylyl-sulfate kinase n=1 Tax=Limisalsivibrio acetivorans TaxID=1304888 RepID=UPI0003B4EBC5|nr:adenylyl-sulfate kinase [Limisalsivibrio acetivorans]